MSPCRAALLALLLLGAVPAGAGARGGPPPATGSIPARAWVVVDDADGAVLAGRAAQQPRAVASITKLMTALLTLRALDLDRSVRVPVAATRIGESNVALKAGARVPVRTLMAALVVPSANDAAETLAVAAAGSEAGFVARMNETAAALGMTSTRYRAPYGLDRPGQHSSALDSVRLARVLMADPRFRALALRPAVVVGGRRFVATNTLLGRYPGDDGVKTGHTDDAGWCIIATAAQGGRRMYAGVLGARDATARDLAARRLLDWGFARYRRVPVVSPGVILGRAAIPYGGDVAIAAGAGFAPVLRDDRRVTTRLVLPAAVTPPLRRGQQVGRLDVSVDGRLRRSVPLVVTRDVPTPSLERKAGWVLRRAGRTLLHPDRWW